MLCYFVRGVLFLFKKWNSLPIGQVLWFFWGGGGGGDKYYFWVFFYVTLDFMNKWLQKIKIQMSGVTVRWVLIGVKTKNGSWNKKKNTLWQISRRSMVISLTSMPVDLCLSLNNSFSQFGAETSLIWYHSR